jgi:predicted aldo/keto reductase-like oxidoreductase
MKALSGGLITDSAMAYAYLGQFDSVEPIWGIQRDSELDEFLSYQDAPPVLSAEMKRRIERDKKELAGDFCRGCGYCMPCPVGILINNCARLSLLLRRAPQESFLSDTWRSEMKKIEDCLHCNQCMNKCPYGLNTPELLIKNYED